ncbi:MAG: ABC transporter permease, partial [Bryobacteraceae bacterium]
VDAVLLKSLPVKNPQQLLVLNWAAPKFPSVVQNMQGSWYQDESGWTSTALSYPIFERIHANASRVLSGVFAFSDLGDINVGASGSAGLAAGQLVSGDYFRTLGVQPVLGRAIGPEDDKPGAPPVAVIGYQYWRQRFGGDPSVVGKAITLNGVAFTVAGVAPPEFFGVQPGSSLDVWVPLRTQPLVDPRAAQPNQSNFENTGHWWVVVMGRKNPGVTDNQARAALDVIFQQSVKPLAKPAPKPSGQPEILPHMQVQPAARGLDSLRREFSKPLFVLLAVVGLVLLIACANVANLLLGRASAREKEIAVRLAIGAGRRRLIRQFLTESVLLALIGGAVGFVLAFWASDLLVTFFASGKNPVALDVSPDLRILGFTAAVSLLTGILFGLAPALRGTRLDLTPALKNASGGKSTVRLGLSKALVVSQVALCLLLLIGAGLFVRTLQNLETANLGFNRSNLLLFRVDPTQSGYKGARLAGFYRDLQARIQTIPGVRSASLSSQTLIGGNVNIQQIYVQGSRLNPTQHGGGGTFSNPFDQPGVMQLNYVGPGFLK